MSWVQMYDSNNHCYWMEWLLSYSFFLNFCLAIFSIQKNCFKHKSKYARSANIIEPHFETRATILKHTQQTDKKKYNDQINSIDWSPITIDKQLI